MKFECPTCKTRYDVPDERLPAARKLRFTCRKCRQDIHVQRPGKSGPPPANPAPDATARGETAVRRPSAPPTSELAATNFSDNTRVLVKEALELMVRTRQQSEESGEAHSDPESDSAAARLAAQTEAHDHPQKPAPVKTAAVSAAELARMRLASVIEDTSDPPGAPAAGLEAQPATRVLSAAGLASLRGATIDVPPPAGGGLQRDRERAEPFGLGPENSAHTPMPGNKPAGVDSHDKPAVVDSKVAADAGSVLGHLVQRRELQFAGVGFALGVLVGVAFTVLLRAPPHGAMTAEASPPPPASHLRTAEAAAEPTKVAGATTEAAAEPTKVAGATAEAAAEPTKAASATTEVAAEPTKAASATTEAAAATTVAETRNEAERPSVRQESATLSPAQSAPHRKTAKAATKSGGKRAVGLSDPSNGCLAVICKPGTSVLMDGQMIAMTPAKCIELPPGAQKIVLENTALGVHEQVQVTIKSGEITRLTRDY